MIFKANYFDGKSSKTYKSSVSISENNWTITFNHDGTNKDIIWKANEITKSKVYTKGLVAFSYGNSLPFEKIESDDPEFIKYASKSNQKNINNKLDTVLHKSAGRSILFLIVLIIGFISGMYFYIIPTIAVNFAEKLPKKHVSEFGDFIFKTLSPGLNINKQQSEKLQSFVDALQLDTEFPIQAYISKNEDLNAFALSGGKIVVFSGLLEKIKNEHQLAALLGHEISHIEQRHVLKSISRDLSGKLFISMILGDMSKVTAIMSENAHLFSQLSYSRSLEKEADIFGMETMKKNNLDLHGMPQLFKLLNNNSKDSSSFLDSHPMLDERIEYSTKSADQQNSFKENNVINEKWSDLKNSLY